MDIPDSGMVFDHRTGPERDVSYPVRDVPDWFLDAKFGIFVHWGLYSIPAFAEPAATALGRPERAWIDHTYAEWYGNTYRIPGSSAQRYHQTTFGVGTSYEDLADQWHIAADAAQQITARAASWGARYVVPTTKHHDGFCLWPTATTGFNAARRGPCRDLVGDFAAAAKQHGMDLGLYFSGALDWHVSDLPPITCDEQLFSLRRNDTAFAQYAARQLQELIAAYQPRYLWNDIDWPDAGKGPENYALAAVLGRFYDHQPDGVINDRWGIPHRGVRTREYTGVDTDASYYWEACRSIGRSFGYNAYDATEELLCGPELIRLLVDTVAHNGNLLLNIGPMADGQLPAAQTDPIDQLGQWLQDNGSAIFGTRPDPVEVPAPWRAVGTATHRYYLALDPPSAPAPTAPDALAQASWLAGGQRLPVHFDGGELTIPDAIAAQPVAALEVPR